MLVTASGRDISSDIPIDRSRQILGSSHRPDRAQILRQPRAKNSTTANAAPKANPPATANATRRAKCALCRRIALLLGDVDRREAHARLINQNRRSEQLRFQRRRHLRRIQTQ